MLLIHYNEFKNGNYNIILMMLINPLSFMYLIFFYSNFYFDPYYHLTLIILEFNNTIQNYNLETIKHIEGDQIIDV